MKYVLLDTCEICFFGGPLNLLIVKYFFWCNNIGIFQILVQFKKILINIFTNIFLLSLKMHCACFSYSKQLRWELFLGKLNLEVHKKNRYILCMVIFSIFLRIDGDIFEEIIIIILSTHPKPTTWRSYNHVLMSIDFL